MNVNRLRQQIADLENRKSELLIERETASNAHLTARKAVLTGKATVSTLEANQTTLNTYDSLISDIETELADKEFKLQMSVIQERNENFMREAIQLANKALTAGNSCADAIKEFSNSMGKTSVDKFLDGRAEIYRCKERLNQIVQDLIPGAQSTIYKSNPEAEAQLEIFWTELEAASDCSILRSNHLIVEYAFPLIDYVQHNTYSMPLNLYPETFKAALRERAAERSKQTDKK